MLLVETQELTWALALLVVQLEWRRDLLSEDNRNRSWLWLRWLSIGVEEGFSVGSDVGNDVSVGVVS